MSDDKVVNFPSTAGGENQETSETPLSTATTAAPKRNDVVLTLVDKNRKKGLEALEKRIENLDGRDTHENSQTESALRDITVGLKSIHTTVEALNSLSDMIRHDLINCIQNLEGQVQANWQSSAHLQTLVEVLKSKELITESELEETWTHLVKTAKERQEKSK